MAKKVSKKPPSSGLIHIDEVSEGLGYQRVKVIPGSTYKDASTVIIIPMRDPMVHWKIVQSWQGLISPMNLFAVMYAAFVAVALLSAAYVSAQPAGVILVVSLLESRFGCDPRSGGCWGAPASARHRRVAGTPDNAARILQHSFEICGDWNSALTRFRSGQCVFRRSLVGYEPSDAVRWIRRAYDRAGLPLPDGMR